MDMQTTVPRKCTDEALARADTFKQLQQEWINSPPYHSGESTPLFNFISPWGLLMGEVHRHVLFPSYMSMAISSCTPPHNTPHRTSLTGWTTFRLKEVPLVLAGIQHTNPPVPGAVDCATKGRVAVNVTAAIKECGIWDVSINKRC